MKAPSRFRSEVLLHHHHLANFGLALPSRPVFLVQLHELPRSFHRLFLRLQLKQRVPADNLFRFREWSVRHGDAPAGKPHARACRRRQQPAVPQQRAVFDRLFRESPNGFHQFFRRHALCFFVFHDHHVSHHQISLCPSLSESVSSRPSVPVTSPTLSGRTLPAPTPGGFRSHPPIPANTFCAAP